MFEYFFIAVEVIKVARNPKAEQLGWPLPPAEARIFDRFKVIERRRPVLTGS